MMRLITRLLIFAHFFLNALEERCLESQEKVKRDLMEATTCVKCRINIFITLYQNLIYYSKPK